MTSFLPQVIKIAREKDASSVSLRMYVVTVTGFALWIVYGLDAEELAAGGRQRRLSGPCRGYPDYEAALFGVVAPKASGAGAR